MPRRNRVDPWGDLHAVGARGLLTGNRGCVVDDHENVVRHHGSSLWICCVLSFRDWRWPLARPGRWTPLFFLDEAVALAAGHRPCGFCRRDAYRQYRDAVGRAMGVERPLRASDLNQRLQRERLRRGRGLARARDRILVPRPYQALPDGAVVVDEANVVRVKYHDALFRFGFEHWDTPVVLPARGSARVLTPPTSLMALANGYRPLLHESLSGHGACTTA